MKLQEAKQKIEDLVNIELGEYLQEEQFKDIIKAKGKSGQLLEITIGLDLSNTDLDFEDGELKTNKCDENGKPLETMFITQISGMIDDLLEKKDFYESKLYKKVKNLLYVPIDKVGEPERWKFLSPVHVNLQEDIFLDIKNQLEKDYYTICDLLNKYINESEDGFIHTSNGKYIQIRSKDSKPYHPIYSEKYGRYVSNKNHAFYFKKEFMKEIVRLNEIISV